MLETCLPKTNHSDVEFEALIPMNILVIGDKLHTEMLVESHFT
jgi:hypothetical protein